MNTKTGKKRTNRLEVVYSPEEFKVLKSHLVKSTNKTFSGYIRMVSLQEPVVVTHRNLSFDAFIMEITSLRNEMAQIRLLNLGRETEDRIIQLHEEIRKKINQIADLCMPS